MNLRPALAAELLVNLALPWAAYQLAEPRWGEIGGLVASSVPPLAWSAVELARARRIDALSAVVLLGIALSFVALVLGGSPRILLMREALVSGMVGVAFLASLLLRRPLVFYLARATVARQSHDGVAGFNALFDTRAGFARAMRLLTAVWGLGLTGEAALRGWFAATWPIPRFLAVTPFISYAVYFALLGWTFWYRTRAMRRADGLVLPGNPARADTPPAT